MHTSPVIVTLPGSSLEIPWQLWHDRSRHIFQQRRQPRVEWHDAGICDGLCSTVNMLCERTKHRTQTTHKVGTQPGGFPCRTSPATSRHPFPFWGCTRCQHGRAMPQTMGVDQGAIEPLLFWESLLLPAAASPFPRSRIEIITISN